MSTLKYDFHTLLSRLGIRGLEIVEGKYGLNGIAETSKPHIENLVKENIPAIEIGSELGILLAIGESWFRGKFPSNSNINNSNSNQPIQPNNENENPKPTNIYEQMNNRNNGGR